MESDSNMTSEDIGVFVLTFNRPEFLARQLDSVLAQTVRPKVVTVLDNGANPETCRVVEARTAQGVRRIGTADLGLRGNLKRAQELCAERKFVALFHDDDWLHPRYLDLAVRVLSAHPDLKLVTCESVMCPFDRFVSPEGETSTCGFLMDEREWASFLLNCGARRYPFSIYSSEAFRRLDIEAISKAHGRGLDIPIMLDVTTGGMAAFLQCPLAIYGRHPGQDGADPNTLPDVRCWANMLAAYRRHIGDGLRNIHSFSYAFSCFRKLRSGYRRRGRRTLSYSDYLAYAADVGAIPHQARWLHYVSSHLAQKAVEKLILRGFRRNAVDLAAFQGD